MQTNNILTGFQQVGIFHKVFGHPVNTELQHNIFDNKDVVKFRLALIEEEINELSDACKTKNLIEAVDALADIMFVCFGMCNVFGINADTHMKYGEIQKNTPKVEENIFENTEKCEDIAKFLSNFNRYMNCLVEKCNEKNISEVTSKIFLIIGLCYKMAKLFGVDIEKCFSEVFRSNMTKVCSSEDEAKETVEWYKQNQKRYNDPSYRKSNCGKYWVIYDRETTKILKSIKYEEPNLKNIIY